MASKTHACGAGLGVVAALAMIDRAVQSGIALDSLQWRVSPAQRTAIWMWLGIGDQPVAKMAGVMRGTFCEIPFYVDPTLAADEIVLEQCFPQPVEVLAGLALPAAYDRLKEWR